MTCDCGAEFSGGHGKRVRCPACARARYLAYQKKYHADHPEKYNVPGRVRTRYQTAEAKRRLHPDANGRWGTIPGTGWIFDLHGLERTPLLALQRIPAERMERWIEEVVLR